MANIKEYLLQTHLLSDKQMCQLMDIIQKAAPELADSDWTLLDCVVRTQLHQEKVKKPKSR